MMRAVVAEYSPPEQKALRRFLRILVDQPVMRAEKVLRVLLRFFDEAAGGPRVEAEKKVLRLVTPLTDESDDG